MSFYVPMGNSISENKQKQPSLRGFPDHVENRPFRFPCSLALISILFP